jgi:hypothetical protein
MQGGRGRSQRRGASEFLRTGRVREDAASVWRRRRHGALTALLVLAVLVPITAAQAAPSVGVIVNFPTNPTVGQTGIPATFTVFNTSTAPDELGTVTVGPLTLIPSCSNFDPGCDGPGSIADPGTFNLSATGTGEAATACAGRQFNITEINPATGQVSLQAADMLPVVLAPSSIATDLDHCQINFTIDVLKAPNHDAIPAEPGLATIQLATASGTHLNGTVVNTANEDITTIPGDAPVTPALTTVASPGVQVGGQITDTATLAGGNNPTGTITFNLYGPDNATCTGPAIFAPVETVAGNGSYTSDAFTTLAAGTYQWVAAYSGDAGNNPVTTACNDPAESVVVTAGPGPVTPTLTTVASPNVQLGGQITDTATLAGGNNPTGTITFSVFGPDDATCTGPALAAPVETVAGNGSYTSDPVTPVAAGTYRWVAVYSGDGGNNPVTTACNDPLESVVVSTGPVLVTPTLTTQVAPATASVGQNIVDTATLAGGNAPTGTITFNAYGPADTTCTGAAVYTATSTVNGNGAYPASPAFVATAPGQYRFIASYSGDALNNPVSGLCNDPAELHTATVSPLPTITVDKTATPGSLPAPTGLFTFNVSVTNSSTVPLVITSINDSVYGNLGTRTGVNSCDDLIGDTLAPAGIASCSFQGSFTGASGATETDVVTVVATDAAANQATGQDSATVALTAPVPPEVPMVQIDITPIPASQKEPGGPVTYRVTITNTSNPVDITITSIVDSFYGNIAALPEPNTCDSVIGQVLSSGESVTCEFTIQFTGDAGTTRTHTITVTATGPGGVIVTDSAPATTVTITDALPQIRVTKEVSPESRPEPGGDFVFEVTVENRSGESVVLTTLGDDVHGDLNGKGTCDTGVTLAAGATYTCTYTVRFNGEDGDRQDSTAIATVVDDEGNSATDSDSVTIRLTDPVAASPSPTASATPTATATPTPAPSAGATPTPTVSSSPTPIPTVTAGTPRPGGIVRTGIESLQWLALAFALIVLGALARSELTANRVSRRHRN